MAARAEAATAYVTQQAQKNIQKMVLMAQQGWAASGNNPFGLDLVCYPVNDLTRPLFRVVRMRYMKPHLFRVITYTTDSKIERDQNGIITRSHLSVDRDENTTSMPPRDKKATGYRLEPSVYPERLNAVRQIFALYAEGMDFGPIADNLYKQGLKHYDKPFAPHAVETILRNPAYTGLPAWGKNGVGQYMRAVGGQAQKVKRKKDETFTTKKAEADRVYSLQPLFTPIIPTEQFNRLQEKIEGRGKTNPAVGKRRTRDTSDHPLNGKVICPDCEQPMVKGSSMPGKKKDGKKHEHYRCFICGTYRGTNRKECQANSTRWDMLDLATEQLLAVVKDRIDAVVTGDSGTLLKADWMAKSELGALMLTILGGETITDTPSGKIVTVPLLGPWYDPDKEQSEAFDKKHGIKRKPDTPRPMPASVWFEEAFAEYDQRFAQEAGPLRAELATVEAELENVANLMMKQGHNPTIYATLERNAGALEKRKGEIVPMVTPITDKARALIDQLKGIKETIEHADRSKRAAFLDTFVKEVWPILENVKPVKGKTGMRRTRLVAFRFVPKDGSNVFHGEMKFEVARRDKGSWPRRVRTGPGRWSSRPPGRW